MASLHYLVKYQCLKTYSVPYIVPLMGHCFLKYKLARDRRMAGSNCCDKSKSQLIGSIDLDSQIDRRRISQWFCSISVTVALCEDSFLLPCRYSLLQQMLAVGHSVNFSVLLM